MILVLLNLASDDSEDQAAAGRHNRSTATASNEQQATASDAATTAAAGAALPVMVVPIIVDYWGGENPLPQNRHALFLAARSWLGRRAAGVLLHCGRWLRSRGSDCWRGVLYWCS